MSADQFPDGRATPDQPAPLHRRLIARWEVIPGNVRGGLWMLAAGAFFAVMSALIKLLGSRLPVVEIMFLRQAVMMATVAPIIARGFPHSLKTSRPGLHLVRVFFALTAMLMGFTAIVHMPLADAIAIGFARPFFVTLFAILILKEVVGLRRWSAIIVGFVGVLIMLRPTGAGIDLYGLYAVAGAAGAGMVMILIRKLSETESPLVILTYQSGLVGLAMLVPALYWWVWPTPDEWLLALILGVVSAAGQSCNIRAYRAGEAAAVAPLDYTRLIYATVLGIWLFSEWPSATTLTGAAIVLAASFYTLKRESSLRRKTAGKAPSTAPAP